MEKSLKAKNRFETSFSCSQSVFSTLAPELGLDEETALKIGSAFGGGMMRHGEVCGAVTGALMTLGLKFGSASPDDEEKIRETGQELMHKFKEKNGSLLCRELLGYHLILPEELEKAKESGVFNSICPLLVKNATELAEEIMKKE
ncbi:MAG: C_GCAxxG_C_C family protein [Anaerolineae bacterium]|jgi:C_GCAxxG_C_C family probable redox protein|nr:C_GCAxxG_C_C family protein [Anaerolineae bacterium]MBT7075036.1 C_GCAxxG_C_C family protein [Anaerolineae bacterium]MBT7783902.1 C_GCAxxG_C_C family protein [Anaerolineae bacterium]